VARQAFVARFAAYTPASADMSRQAARAARADRRGRDAADGPRAQITVVCRGFTVADDRRFAWNGAFEV
jgi:hypothetical protein